MLSFKSEMEFEKKDFNAGNVQALWICDAKRQRFMYMSCQVLDCRT